VSKTGHWDHTGLELDPERAVGFVYLIVYKETNQKYIGKKNYRGRGKLNKGQESNWKSYTSSSAYLTQLIKEKGKENFVFVILEQYYTTGGLSFAETWSQVICETPSKNEEFMNRFIDKVTWKVTEPVTERHKKRLKHYLRKYKHA
jgi:hypothetical protein